MLYAVGDIHGEREMLEELLAKLPLREGDELVFVGDYVDRGPDSRGVVDVLLGFQRRYPCTFLCGNHESTNAEVMFPGLDPPPRPRH